MVNFIQILIVAFSLFALSRLIIRRKDRSVPLGEFIFWSVIWLGAIVLVLFPDVLTAAADKTGIGRAIDLVVYTAVIAIFYLIFRLYVKVEQQQQDITRLVRKIALQGKKKGK